MPRHTGRPLRELRGRFTEAGTSSGDPLHLCEVERRHVLEVLRQVKGNKVHAAKDIGIGSQSMYRLIEKYLLLADHPDSSCRQVRAVTVHRRPLNREATQKARGTSSVNCRSGQRPTPSTGTTGMRLLYDQRPEASPFHSTATAHAPPRRAAVA